MLIRESITVKISGDKFSPAEAERRTGLHLTNKVEPGDIRSRGQHKGQPYPYGYANLVTADEIPHDNKLSNLLDVLLTHIDTLREVGAADIIVYGGYFYEDQCNLTFWPDAMEKLGRLGIPFWVSCYEFSDHHID